MLAVPQNPKPQKLNIDCKRRTPNVPDFWPRIFQFQILSFFIFFLIANSIVLYMSNLQ